MFFYIYCAALVALILAAAAVYVALHVSPAFLDWFDCKLDPIRDYFDDVEEE